MRWIFSLAMTFAVAGVLTLIAWPMIDPPDEPALTFVDVGSSAWTAPQSAWIGDDDKRNAILMSAVWGRGKGAK